MNGAADPLPTLLAVYAALVAFNLALSFALWLGNRERLYAVLCALWLGALCSFGLQAATSANGEAMIGLGGASLVLIALPVGHLVHVVMEERTPWRLWGGVYGIGVVLGLVAYLAGAPFAAYTTPALWGAMFPGLHSSILCFRRWSALPATLRMLGVVTFAQCLHGMDFPFFRLRTDLVVEGYSVALMALLGVSILAPAVIIEKIAGHNLRNVSALMDALARFVPTEVLVHLKRRSIVDVRLGDGVRVDMTVMFADIRSFTSLSEKLTPEETFRFLNSYLSRMEPIIKRHGGFIDKYLGDGILAVFSRGADDGVRAALELDAALIIYNGHRARSGYVPVDIGIGIHTGSVMLGTVGGADRMQGTVVGDAVNLASRIEALTSHYGTRILISEQTRGRLASPSDFPIRLVDRVVVKGRVAPVTLYQVLPPSEAGAVDVPFERPAPG